jgi:hypothetical protein
MNLINYSIKKLNADKHEDSLITTNPDETMISSLTGDKSITSACCNCISLLNDYSTIKNEAANHPNEIEANTTKSSIGWPNDITPSFYMDLKEIIELATKEGVKRLEVE